MKKAKITLLALATVMAISTQAPLASAAALDSTMVVPANDSRMIITPRWSSTTLVIPTISYSGQSISVSILITPKQSGAKSSGTLYLEQYNGSRWQSVKSWSINKSGTVDITNTYSGKSGIKYRAKVVVTTGEDRITATSSEITL
jgi:hypothetical protein